MPLLTVREFHQLVIEAKENGVPITTTLRNHGVSKTSYYRMLEDSGETLWQDRARGKMVAKTKKKMIKTREMTESDTDTSYDDRPPVGLSRHLRQRRTPLVRGMSGGGLAASSVIEDDTLVDSTGTSDTLKGIALAIKQSQDRMKKYQSKYIDE